MTTVTPAGTTPPEAGRRRRVVVGVDGSRHALKALQWAREHAARIDADLDVVTVWNLPVTYGWALPPDAEGHPGRHARNLLDDELVAVFGPELPDHVRRHVLEGHPSAELVTAAEGADLLVVGSRGLGVVTSALTGSVSSECAHHATCPVAIIRD